MLLKALRNLQDMCWQWWEPMVAGNFEVKLLTVWTVVKAEAGRVAQEKGRTKKIREEKGRWKEIQLREKGEKLRSTLFFQCFVASKGWKVGSLKRGVRSHLARWDVKNGASTLRYSKSACGCPAKHVSNSKCAKHVSSWALLEVLEVEMLQKCTPLWYEAHFEG